MEKELKNNEANELFEAIASIQNKDEAKKFMRDLCTLAELKAMSERFQVAKLLKSNLPYREIAKKADSSTATVTRVASWLHHGTGGYKLILHRLFGA